MRKGAFSLPPSRDSTNSMSRQEALEAEEGRLTKANGEDEEA